MLATSFAMLMFMFVFIVNMVAVTWMHAARCGAAVYLEAEAAVAGCSAPSVWAHAPSNPQSASENEIVPGLAMFNVYRCCCHCHTAIYLSILTYPTVLAGWSTAVFLYISDSPCSFVCVEGCLLPCSRFTLTLSCLRL
jgi:hypothetical protein